MATKRRIFLAHGSEDKTEVRRLYADLKRRGFDPWLDEEDLVPGQIWNEEIPRAIREAGVFLACLSSRSAGRIGYVQNEFRLALAALSERPAGSIYLVPVRLDDCEIPDLQLPDRGLSLRQLHWVDLWRHGGLDRLARAIEQALANRRPWPPDDRRSAPTSSGDSPSEPRRRTSRFWWVFALVALAGVLGLWNSPDRQSREPQPPPPIAPEPLGPSVPLEDAPLAAEKHLKLSGTDWRQIQAALAELGFDPGRVDGIPGRNTRLAISRWQTSHSQDRTGYLDDSQRDSLVAAAKVQPPTTTSVTTAPQPPACDLVIANRLATIHTEPRRFSEEISAISPGSYKMLDFTRIPFGPTIDLWFKIAVEGRTGWVPGDSWHVARRIGSRCP